MSDLAIFWNGSFRKIGYSVYGFAQEAGVDRANTAPGFKRAIGPQRAFFQKVVKTLRLFPQERERLLENYNILKNGESVFYQRAYIKKRLERFNDLAAGFLQFLLAGISPGRRSCCGAAFPASGESIWLERCPSSFFRGN